MAASEVRQCTSVTTPFSQVSPAARASSSAGTTPQPMITTVGRVLAACLGQHRAHAAAAGLAVQRAQRLIAVDAHAPGARARPS